MAASGSHAGDIEVARSGTVLHLKEAIQVMKKLRTCFEQKLLLGSRLLHDSELIRDVFPSAADGPVELQLVCQPPEPILQDVANMRAKLSKADDPPIQEAIDSGFAPRCIEYLRETGWHDLQFEAAWVLTNICSGTTAQTQAVVDQGAVPCLVALLESPNPKVCDQAVWALGNISGDGPGLRDAVLAAGAMPRMLDILRAPDGLARDDNQVLWAISNCLRGRPPPEHDQVGIAIPVLADRLQRRDEEQWQLKGDKLPDLLWALSYLTGPDEWIEEVAQSGACEPLVQLLSHDNDRVLQPALRTIANIVAGTATATQRAVDCGCVPLLHGLLASPSAAVRKEACWALSNVAAGTQEQIEALLECDAVPSIIRLLSAEADERVLREALYVPHNVLSEAAEEQKRRVLAQEGLREAIVALCDSTDGKTASLAKETMALLPDEQGEGSGPQEQPPVEG